MIHFSDFSRDSFPSCICNLFHSSSSTWVDCFASTSWLAIIIIGFFRIFCSSCFLVLSQLRKLAQEFKGQLAAKAPDFRFDSDSSCFNREKQANNFVVQDRSDWFCLFEAQTGLVRSFKGSERKTGCTSVTLDALSDAREEVSVSGGRNSKSVGQTAQWRQCVVGWRAKQREDYFNGSRELKSTEQLGGKSKHSLGELSHLLKVDLLSLLELSGAILGDELLH